MEKIKLLCLDQVKIDKHDCIELLKEDWVDPKSEPFSTLCKRAEKEGLNYSFENEVLKVWKTKIPYESNWHYQLFYYNYPIVKINEFEIL